MPGGSLEKNHPRHGQEQRHHRCAGSFLRFAAPERGRSILLERMLNLLSHTRSTSLAIQRFVADLTSKRSALFRFLGGPDIAAANWRAERPIRLSVVMGEVCGKSQRTRGRQPQVLTFSPAGARSREPLRHSSPCAIPTVPLAAAIAEPSPKCLHDPCRWPKTGGDSGGRRGARKIVGTRTLIEPEAARHHQLRNTRSQGSSPVDPARLRLTRSGV